MSGLELTDAEFTRFQRMLYEIAGIHLAPIKKPLVFGRLSRRVQQVGCENFSDYFKLLRDGKTGDELQVAVDLLTTNETYFFREPRHFELLAKTFIPQCRGTGEFRVWSAASSSGEEAYSLAMVLSDNFRGAPWRVLGTDISSRVLERARAGQYPMARTKDISPAHLQTYCLKGVGAQDGMFTIKPSLRERVTFQYANLNSTLPSVGEFEVIFLRNVLIYFDLDTKRQVVERVAEHLRPGGYFIVSHSESLNGVTETLKMIQPSVYRKA